MKACTPTGQKKAQSILNLRGTIGASLHPSLTKSADKRKTKGQNLKSGNVKGKENKKQQERKPIEMIDKAKADKDKQEN